VNAHDGFPVWSERYDRQADDIFAIEDEIATAIAQKLRVSLAASADEPVVKRPTDNLAAYELYLKGRFFVNQRGAAVLRGLECFEKARRLDPAMRSRTRASRARAASSASTDICPATKRCPRREARR